MVEIFKLLIEAIVKAAPTRSDRLRSRNAELGVELLQFYVTANETLVTGNAIVWHLRNLLPPSIYLLWEQARNLDAIRDSLRTFDVPMAALMDGASNRELNALFFGKEEAIRQLIDLLRAGILPLDTHLALESGHPGAHYVDSLDRLDIKHLNNKEALTITQRYLEVRNPEADLERIAELLETLRASILEQFTLSDVLVQVKRPKRRDDLRSI